MKGERSLRKLPELALWLIRIERAYAKLPLVDLLAWLTPPQWSYAASWSEAEAIRDATELLVHHLPRPNKLGNCLAQSLLRYTALRRRGFPVEFHMGLRRDDGDLAGHAWLTHHGQPLWEDEAQPVYQTTFRYPAPSQP